MATLLGSEAEPTYGQAWYGSGSYNKMAKPLVMPAGGPWLIPQVGFWAAGKDAAPTAYACLWNAAGTLLAASASFALSNQSFGLGHNTKYTKDLVSPPTVNGGVTVYPGWARLSTSAHQYGYDNGGTDHYKYANATIPGSMNYGTVDGNNIGVFLYYQLANSAPNAPTLLTPSGGVILTGTDLTPALSFKYTDPEGNNSSAYQVQVDDNSDFSSPVWDSGKVNLVVANNATITVSPPSNLSRGVLYYWRARVYDSGGLVSGWSV